MPNARLKIEGIDTPHPVVTFVVDQGVPALGLSTMTELEGLTETLKTKSYIRTLTFMGQGRVFAAGGDLKEFMGLKTREQGRAMAVKMRRVLEGLQTLPFVVIAMLNGDAYGGGVEFALGCDIRLAVEGVKMSLSQCRFGLIPGWGGATRLVHAVGPGRALELLVTGKGISAEEARVLGLIQRVFARESWRKELDSFKSEIEACSPDSVATAKRVVYRAQRSLYGDSISFELEEFAGLWNSRDHKEGLRAFFSKEKPRWKNG